MANQVKYPNGRVQQTIYMDKATKEAVAELSTNFNAFIVEAIEEKLEKCNAFSSLLKRRGRKENKDSLAIIKTTDCDYEPLYKVVRKVFYEANQEAFSAFFSKPQNKKVEPQYVNFQTDNVLTEIEDLEWEFANCYPDYNFKEL